MPHASNCEWRGPAGCTCGNSRRNAAFAAARELRDTLVRLRANRAELEEAREIHVRWRDFMDTATLKERERHRSVGDGDWHRRYIARYNERIACIDIAINLATAALAREAA